MSNRTPQRKRKKFIALRLSDEVLGRLEKLAYRTRKTKTRLVEEAILLHSKELA